MSTDTAQFTSRHAIGDEIHVAGKVKAVHFTESKVNYTVEIGGYLFPIDSCDAHLPAAEYSTPRAAVFAALSGMTPAHVVEYLLTTGNGAGILELVAGGRK